MASLRRSVGHAASAVAVRPGSLNPLPYVVRGMEVLEDWMQVGSPLAHGAAAGLLHQQQSPRYSDGLPPTVSSVTLEETSSLKTSNSWNVVQMASSGPSNLSDHSGVAKAPGKPSGELSPAGGGSPGAGGSADGGGAKCGQKEPSCGEDRSRHGDEDVFAELAHGITTSTPCVDYYPVGSMELDAVLTKELVEGGLGGAGTQPAAGGSSNRGSRAGSLAGSFHGGSSTVTPTAVTGRSSGAGASPKQQQVGGNDVMSLQSFLNEDVPSFPFSRPKHEAKWTSVRA